MTPRLAGQLAGLVAVASWGGYMALTRAGVNQGLHVADFFMLRFGVAGLVMLAFIPRQWAGLRRLGLWRVLLLSVLVGPLFTLLAVAGYRYAPLTHGAVVQPVTVTVVVVLGAAVFLGDRLTRQRLVGVGMAVLGVALVGFGGAGAASTTGPTWIGDLLFVGAGLLWAAFTLLLKKWRVDPVLATAAVTVVPALAVVPLFIAFDTFGRLLALPGGALAGQMLVQGVMSGVIALIAFGMAVKHLGAGASALFPAMVPVAATLIGVPLTGEAPAPLQAVGLVLATAGLVSAMVRWRRG